MLAFLEKIFNRAWLYPSWSWKEVRLVPVRAEIFPPKRQMFYKLISRYRERGGGIPTDLILWWKLIEEETGFKVKIHYAGLDPEKYKNPQAFLFHLEKNAFLIKMRASLTVFEQRIVEAHESAHILFDFYREYNGDIKVKDSVNHLSKLMWAHELFCDDIAGVILCMPYEVERYLKAHFRFPLQMDLFDRYL